ncbi:MAG TPA: protein kinase [Solirubrobacteraceae bacterium]|nr:protein kinase [Solirubrobacteraceae bacterium]
MVVDGYIVKQLLDNRLDDELRYAARGPDGNLATVVFSTRPHPNRRARSRFRRLAARRRDIEHPALIPVRRIDEHDGHAVLVMDTYPSRTFGELVAKRAPLAPDQVVELLAPVADAIDLAHRHGLVHQALGIDSLLVQDGGRLVLDSFGVVVPHDDAPPGLDQTGDVRYRPPEQVRGQVLDPVGNVYSLAAIAVHALTGAPPFRGNPPAVSYAQLVEPPPAVSTRLATLGTEVDAVVARGMAKEPDARHGSAGELIRELAEALGVGPAPIQVTGARPGPRRPAARSRAATAIAVITVSAVVGSLAGERLDPLGAGDSRAGEAPAATTWTQLNAQRAKARAELAAAKTPREQAAAASGLASAYRSAGRDEVRPGLAAAASAASAAYSDLAAAANRGDARAYDEAAGGVLAAERRLQRTANLQQQRK